MKTRWIVIMIVLIIVAIIISLNSGRKSPGTVLAPQEQSLTQTSGIALETQPQPVEKPSEYLTGNSAITIVKTPDKEEQALPAISQPKRKIEPQIRSTQEEDRAINPAVSDTTSEFTGGITEIGKEPTPQEKDEMKSKGIIIF